MEGLGFRVCRRRLFLHGLDGPRNWATCHPDHLQKGRGRRQHAMSKGYFAEAKSSAENQVQDNLQRGKHCFMKSCFLQMGFRIRVPRLWSKVPGLTVV